METHNDTLQKCTRHYDFRVLIEQLAVKFRHPQGLPCFDENLLLSFSRVLAGSSSATVTLDDVRERLATIKSSRDALLQLLSRPSIPQRTPAWYEARNGMITASDFAQALGEGKFGTQKQLFWKKCLPQLDDAFAALANCPPIKWGTMYENVAQMLYSKRYGLFVHEFGLLQHPGIPHLGASPDGVTEMGVMLEIKCPYRRLITGQIPIQYFYQIQGQLEVCGLTECDFLEVGLEELCRNDFIESASGPGTFGVESSPSQTSPNEHGIVVEYMSSLTGKSTYEYSGVDWPLAALLAYEESKLKQQLDAGVAVRMHYWRVKVWSCIRVKKDPEFVEQMVRDLHTIWSRIVAYRQDPALLASEVGLPPATAASSSSAVESTNRPRPRRDEFTAGEYAFREPPSSGQQ